MDRRTLLAIALIFTLTLVWSKLSRQFSGNPAENTLETDTVQVAAPTETRDLPPVETSGTNPSAAAVTPVETIPAATGQAMSFTQSPEITFSVETSVIRAEYSSRGGILTSWLCLDYPGAEAEFVELLPVRDELSRPAAADVLVFSKRELPLRDISFSTDGNLNLEVTDQPRDFVLTAEANGGVVLRKIMSFLPGSYAYDERYEIDFNSTEARASFLDEYGEPVSARYVWDRGIAVTEEQVSGMVRQMPSFRSFAMVGDEIHILNRKDLTKNDEKSGGSYRGSLRFAGLQNKYFTNLGFVPNAIETVVDGRIRLGGDQETMHQSWEIELPLRENSGVIGASLSRYLGPSEYNRLRSHNSHLERTVNLGWKWIQPISELMLGIMNWLHKFIPNYGWVIVAISILSKLAFYPLTQRGTKSMKNMQESQARLKPKMDALKSKCGSDSQRYNQELMKLYKEEGVNPMAGMMGCLPMLIQMPVFIALYQVLYNMVDLRQTPFIFWIDDLSRPDALFILPFTLPFIGSAFNLLPIIMAIATWAQTKLTPQTGGGSQMAAMNNIMPVMMLFFLYNMPSGLVIYWTINTAMTAFQSWTVNRSAATAGGASA
jgi:YidC/Oxa1 family membrane protein insertase